MPKTAAACGSAFVKVDIEISTASSHYIVPADFPIKRTETPFSIYLLIGSSEVREHVVLTRSPGTAGFVVPFWACLQKLRRGGEPGEVSARVAAARLTNQLWQKEKKKPGGTVGQTT